MRNNSLGFYLFIFTAPARPLGSVMSTHNATVYKDAVANFTLPTLGQQFGEGQSSVLIQMIRIVPDGRI